MRLIKLNNNGWNNCWPSAVSVLLDVPYNDLNDYLLAKGIRTERAGTKFYALKLSEFGLEEVRTVDLIAKDLTVNQFTIKKPLEGNFLFHVSNNRHALSYKNGIIYDTRDSSRRKINRAWRLIESRRVPSDFNEVIERFRVKKKVALNDKFAKAHGKLFKQSVFKTSRGDKKQAVIHFIELYKQQKLTISIKDLAIAAGVSYIYARWIKNHYTPSN